VLLLSHELARGNLDRRLGSVRVPHAALYFLEVGALLLGGVDIIQAGKASRSEGSALLVRYCVLVAHYFFLELLALGLELQIVFKLTLRDTVRLDGTLLCFRIEELALLLRIIDVEAKILDELYQLLVMLACCRREEAAHRLDVDIFEEVLQVRWRRCPAVGRCYSGFSCPVIG